MFPLLPQELGRDFDLAEVLRYGSLPVIWAASQRREALESYVQMYLKEEIQAESLVRNLSGFARFLPVAAVFHGQVLSVAGLARDAGVARTTVDGYLGILSDTYLAWLLPAFEARLRVKERRHPKLYWTDSGTGHPFDGLWYWAPAEGQIEVDFLIKAGRQYVAVEAKAKASLASRDLSGLRAISGLAGLKRRMVVYLGDRPQRTEDGIDVLPLRDFLASLEDHRLW